MVMETHEIIRALRDAMDSQYIQENCDEIIDLLRQAADKLEQLRQFVDDMHNDHYVDYLDFYFNRCWELEDKVDLLEAEVAKNKEKN